MIFATRSRAGDRDGELILVDSSRSRGVSCSSISSSLRVALENWDHVYPELQKLSQELNSGKLTESFPISSQKLESALPRSFLFADGSAFIHHIKLVRKARGAALPEDLLTRPLMYQAESSRFLRPSENIRNLDSSFGTDLEAEVGVITDFVPMGTTAEAALAHIRLVVLINDVSLRGLIPTELAQGFGFFQSKPAKALSPFALTLDELGSAWGGGRVKLPLQVRLNEKFFGNPDAGAMHFHFGELIAHASRTRDLQPGTLIGSGTVSNEDPARGCGCIAEKRTIEQIESGKPSTPFLGSGDLVEIWMESSSGVNLFGKIAQRVD